MRLKFFSFENFLSTSLCLPHTHENEKFKLDFSFFYLYFDGFFLHRIIQSESDLQRSTISTTVATTMLMKRETATTTTTTTTPDPFEDFESGELISDGDLKKLSKIIKINDENLPKLKKISTKLNKLVEKVDENHGHIRPELLIDEFLPDPVSVRDIPVSKEDGWLSSYTGQFSNVMMYGIRNVEIKSIRINVGKLYANVSCDNVFFKHQLASKI